MGNWTASAHATAARCRCAYSACVAPTSPRLRSFKHLARTAWTLRIKDGSTSTCNSSLRLLVALDTGSSGSDRPASACTHWIMRMPECTAACACLAACSGEHNSQHILAEIWLYRKAMA